MNYRKFPNFKNKPSIPLKPFKKLKKRTFWERLVRPKYIIIPRPQTEHQKAIMGGFLGLVSILVITIMISFFPIIFFNVTDSAPHGIYIRVLGQATYGDYTVVRLPHSIYLDNGRIEPEGKQLIKMVRALPGDTFTIEPTEIKIHEKDPREFERHSHHFDSEKDSIYKFYISYVINPNPTLPHIPNGTYTVPEGSKLYINPPVGSFDSRYLGPIDDHYEIGKIILLLDFKYINRFLSLFELNEVSL